MNDAQKFTKSLEDWYAHHKRDLPWRKDETAYRVWVSEIMLQQTQVKRVAEGYYPRFLEKFPSVEVLANAEWDEVYPYWKGLGYYRRGQNLLRAAKIIVEKYGSEFPRTAKGLQILPGIGVYTSAAIQSFSWDMKVPAIDTNISKIIQILHLGGDIEAKANELISYARSGRVWNSAMMDLATALREGKEIDGELGKYFPEDIRKQFIPLRRKKPATKNIDKPKTKQRRKRRIEIGVACIHKDGKYLIQTRPKGKSFVGQWEFPGGKREKGEDFRGCVKREIMEELGIEVSVRPHFYEKIYEFDTTFLVLRYHRCQIQAGEPKPLEKQKIQWIGKDDFGTVDFLDTSLAAIEKLQAFTS